MWDGDADFQHEPIITHGNTDCTKVPLEQVVRAIAEDAFSASPYPLILSLENHCSLPQQRICARLFQKHFGVELLHGHGPALLPPPEARRHHRPGSPSEVLLPPESLASPHELRGRVLLKGKARTEHRRLPSPRASGLSLSGGRHSCASCASLSSASSMQMTPPAGE